MGPGGLATPNRAGVCGRPPTTRPLLTVREDGGCIVLVLGVGRCAFRPPRVVFVLGLVSFIILSLLATKQYQLTLGRTIRTVPRAYDGVMWPATGRYALCRMHVTRERTELTPWSSPLAHPHPCAPHPLSSLAGHCRDASARWRCRRLLLLLALILGAAHRPSTFHASPSTRSTMALSSS